MLKAAGKSATGGAHRARRSTSSNTGQITQMPTVARVLFMALSGAGLNEITLDGPDLKEAKVKLRSHLNTLFLDRNAKVKASDLFFFSFRDLDNLSRRILSNRYEWGGLVPQGFILDHVQKHSSANGTHTLTVNDKPHHFKGRLIVPGEDTPGPWLAIALVAKAATSGQAEIHQVYLHPADSVDSYVLVDSDLERRTLAVLRRVQKESRRFSTLCSITKPLLDSKVDQLAVRPDFIVERDGRRVVVEAMGYVDEEYIEQKERTHSLMRRLPGVELLITYTGQDEQALDRSLSHFFTAW